ncbi:alkaline phosphatase family protein [Microlunatus parietis]|uniref:Putative AlkP superfamily pyrophosphatase or phosphodiesterase n=1 Tax=Microlunatus parietis TaxID=682979 RepID=A0A7Y9IEP0_9ACTN|nr:nucleotide pyrophosphatase/phosphodiesterase family protein [Microlunatus parietis]NYE75477.1 putative AlkP superfamily pyrophosphatase or phosphodiesterase [Microlunatus parietis]
MIIPHYGATTLAELLPGLAAHLGVPSYDSDPLALPDAQRYVLIVIDGLGDQLVRRAIRQAPYLAGLLDRARTITSGVPSTTVTSLTCLGTGMPPGRHGMVGWTARVPQTREILNHLFWESAIDPEAYQALPTIFDRASAAGVATTTVSLDRFTGSGLTRAALRGAEFRGFRDEDDLEGRAAMVARAAQRGQRSLVYAYERRLDHAGHAHGVSSHDWHGALTDADALCRAIRDRLDDDVRMIITGDHGMIDIPDDHRIVIEDDPELDAGVTDVAGEGRFRQLYVDHDRPEAVAARWRDRLGDRAWVRTRDEAIEDGWFGPVDESIKERYGHVVAAFRDDWAGMTRRMEREMGLIGMHGSLTEAEMIVPLFVD